MSAPRVGFRVRGRIGAIFLARHAISLEDATAFVPEPRDVGEFARLRANGIVREVRRGEYWFDLPAYFARAEAISRRVTFWSFIVAVVGAGVAVLLYRG